MRILSIKQMKQLIENAPEGGIVFYEIEYEAIKDSYGEIQWQLNSESYHNPQLLVTDGKFGATELVLYMGGFPCYNNSAWVKNNLIDGLNPIENNDFESYNSSELFDFDWNINEFPDYDNKEYVKGKINIMPGMKMTNFVVFNKNEIQMMIDLLNKALKVKGVDLDD